MTAKALQLLWNSENMYQGKYDFNVTSCSIFHVGNSYTKYNISIKYYFSVGIEGLKRQHVQELQDFDPQKFC